MRYRIVKDYHSSESLLVIQLSYCCILVFRRFLHDVPKIYFPAIWFRQTAHVDDKIGPELELLAALPSAGTISSLVLLSIGLTTILVVGIFYLTRRCSKDDETFHGLVN